MDIRLIIRKHGWFVAKFEGTAYLPSFAYTIGLLESFQHSELIVFGLDLNVLHGIINHVGSYIRDHGPLISKQRYSNFIESHQVQFVDIDSRNIKDYFGYALSYYDTDNIRAMQLVWPDSQGRFPWETKFDEGLLLRQPLLDRNAEFKFREPWNLGVYTTAAWVEEIEPITHVYHDEDGDWQFITRTSVETEAKLVSLQSIVDRDPTVNSVFNLDYGEQAVRERVG